MVMTLLGVLAMVAALPTTAIGEVPHQISYQGYITDGLGNPLDGEYWFLFSIYDVPTGGTALWYENPHVRVMNGVYNVHLGLNPLGNPFPEGLFDGQRWLGVAVESDPEMVPRQLLTSTSFSKRAAVADSVEDGVITTIHLANDAVTGDKIDDGAVSSSHIQDGAVLSEILDDAGSGSGLDADKLDGLDASAFLSTGSDYGRYNIAGNLYEGTTTLTNKYVNQSGDDMIGRFTASVTPFDTDWNEAIKGSLLAGSSDVGAGVFGYAEGASAYGIRGSAIGANGVGVYGETTSSSGTGIKGQAPAGGWAGYFEGGLYVSGNVGIGTTDPKEKLHVEGNIRIPNNISIKNAHGNEIFHTGWHTQFGDYTDIKSGYAWGSGEPVSVVAGEYGVFFTKGDEVGNPHAETLMKVNTNGRLSCSVLEITGGSDIAEPFEIQKPDNIKAGMVMVIDPDNPGKLKVSAQAYDRRVAGVVSGAGGVNHGMLMVQKGSAADGATPIALSGRVYCLADVSNGTIEPGDLLTTSDTPGHAMKATDRERSFGSVIGKAMSLLEADRGLVLVLVTLQ
jgi:hypothetical protein